MIDDYSGVQKAAILLITLGPENAAVTAPFDPFPVEKPMIFLPKKQNKKAS